MSASLVLPRPGLRIVGVARVGEHFAAGAGVSLIASARYGVHGMEELEVDVPDRHGIPLGDGMERELAFVVLLGAVTAGITGAEQTIAGAINVNGSERSAGGTSADTPACR